jgi:hypothetical protein
MALHGCLAPDAWRLACARARDIAMTNDDDEF